MLHIGQLVHNRVLDIGVVVIGNYLTQKLAVTALIYNDGSCLYSGATPYDIIDLYYKDEEVYKGKAANPEFITNGMIDLKFILNNLRLRTLLRSELDKAKEMIHKPLQLYHDPLR